MLAGCSLLFALVVLVFELDQVVDQQLLVPLVYRRLNGDLFGRQKLELHLVAELRAEARLVVLLRLEVHAQLRVSAELGERVLGPSLEESDVHLERERVGWLVLLVLLTLAA